jgi:electron transport complex protein RnfG
MMKNNYIGQAWLVLLLALIFGSSLAGVQTALEGRIKKNKRADTMSQIPNLVPGAATGKQEIMGDLVVFRAMDDSGKQVGWVVQAGGQGFADVIELLIGLNRDASKITGLYILDQKETPGLGNRIVNPQDSVYAKAQQETEQQEEAAFSKMGVDDSFRLQFSGKSTVHSLSVTKQNDAAPDNEKIDALTGATISSESVVDIVNKAITKFKKAKD